MGLPGHGQEHVEDAEFHSVRLRLIRRHQYGESRVTPCTKAQKTAYWVVIRRSTLNSVVAVAKGLRGEECDSDGYTTGSWVKPCRRGKQCPRDKQFLVGARESERMEKTAGIQKDVLWMVVTGKGC